MKRGILGTINITVFLGTIAFIIYILVGGNSRTTERSSPSPTRELATGDAGRFLHGTSGQARNLISEEFDDSTLTMEAEYGTVE